MRLRQAYSCKTLTYLYTLIANSYYFTCLGATQCHPLVLATINSVLLERQNAGKAFIDEAFSDEDFAEGDSDQYESDEDELFYDAPFVDVGRDLGGEQAKPLSERTADAKASIDLQLEKLLDRANLVVHRGGKERDFKGMRTLFSTTARVLISFMASKPCDKIPDDWKKFDDTKFSSLDNFRILARRYESKQAFFIFECLCIIASMCDMSHTCTRWTNQVYMLHQGLDLLNETDPFRRLQIVTSKKPAYYGEGVPGRCHYHEGQAYVKNCIAELMEDKEKAKEVKEMHPNLEDRKYCQIVHSMSRNFKKGESYSKTVIRTGLPANMGLAGESSLISLNRGVYNIKDGADLKSIFDELFEYVDEPLVTQFIASFFASKVVWQIDTTTDQVSSENAVLDTHALSIFRKVVHYFVSLI